MSVRFLIVSRSLMPIQLLMIALLVLAGACGFQPVYDQGGNLLDKLDHIALEGQSGRDGQTLHNALARRLHQRKGVADGPRPKLDFSGSFSQSDLGTSLDATQLLSRVKASVRFKFYEAGADLPVLEFTVKRSLTFVRQGTSSFTTQVSAETARSQLAEAVAEEALRRLGLYLKSHDENQK